MNTKNNNSPKRRFPNFESNWIDYEFKALLDSCEGIRRGPFGSALKKEFFVPKSEYVVYEQNNAIYNTWDTRYYINREKFQELEKFQVLPGDFLLSGAGTIGRIAQVPKGVEQGVFNQALIRLRINKSFVNENFFLIWMQSDKMQEKLTDANPGSAMTNLVPMSELKKWIVSIPKKEEQTRISCFIFKINTLISLHQHKLDKLKNLKKAYLTEMFPAEGERVPKRRFPGFEGEWEWKKLGELATIVRGASPRPIQDPKWFDSESEVGWLRISDVTEQNGRIYKLSQRLSSLGQEKTRVVSEPHLILSIAATVGKPVINYVRTGIHDGFLIFQEPKFEIEYMYYLLGMFRKNWAAYGQPGSQLNLNSDIVKEQRVAIPSQSEQVEISKFFKKLDQSITLQQQKLDKLNDLKKAYLNELFV